MHVVFAFAFSFLRNFQSPRHVLTNSVFYEFTNFFHEILFINFFSFFYEIKFFDCELCSRSPKSSLGLISAFSQNSVTIECFC